MREALERFGRLLQTSGDLVRVGPVGGIQAIGQRAEGLLSRGIRCPVRNAFANDRMPVREKRNAFVWCFALDHGRNGEAGWCSSGRDWWWRRRRDGRRGRNRGRLLFTSWPPPPRLGRRFDHLLALANRHPVELDVGIL